MTKKVMLLNSNNSATYIPHFYGLGSLQISFKFEILLLLNLNYTLYLIIHNMPAITQNKC